MHLKLPYQGFWKNHQPPRNVSSGQLSLGFLYANFLEVHEGRLVGVQLESGAVVAHWVSAY